MIEPGTATQLAQLDAYRPAALDPALFAANLAALAADQPQFADALRHVVLPETWRPALALDDFTTYRLEPPGGPAVWFGGSAVPLTRARARLAKLEFSGKNPALPTCGAGAETHHLLKRLPSHLALYIFETEIAVLAAVLRAQDWSAAITRGRCILVPPGREAPALNTLMDMYPGLLPPGEILLADLVAPARLAELRAIGERLSGATQEHRRRRLGSLQPDCSPCNSEIPGLVPRLAVLSLTPRPATHAIAEQLERAARRLGWPVSYQALADPRSVHPLRHCQALAEFQPELTICANHPRTLLPLPLPGTVCTWFHEEPAAGAELPADGTLCLAASPAIAAGLRRAGAKPDHILDWYWACEPLPDEPADSAAEPTLLLVADLPDSRPATCGIQHSTHLKLWAQLAVAIAEAWEKPRVLKPEGLLLHAERQSGVEMTDAALREALLRLIDRVLIPAVVLERVAATLADERRAVLVVGRGWDRLAGGDFRTLATSVFELPEHGAGLHPSACVFAGRPDPLQPALLHAAARGWPLLLHSPGGQPLGPALGDVLRPDQHFGSFASVSALRESLRSLRAAPQVVLRRAERARRHVAEQHSYERRLQELLRHVRGDSPPERC